MGDKTWGNCGYKDILCTERGLCCWNRHQRTLAMIDREPCFVSINWTEILIVLVGQRRKIATHTYKHPCVGIAMKLTLL